MRLLVTHRYRSFCAMLCMVLTMVFAAMSLSSTLDRVQHAPGAPAHHEHMIFSDVSAEEIHADHHEQAPEGDAPDDHLTGGHHYHADGGSGMMAQASDAAVLPDVSNKPQAMERLDNHTGVHAPGPDRPPRPLTMEA